MPANEQEEHNSVAFLRTANPENIDAVNARGMALWNSIYEPHAVKLHDKLASYHPDLICTSPFFLFPSMTDAESAQRLHACARAHAHTHTRTLPLPDRDLPFSSLCGFCEPRWCWW